MWPFNRKKRLEPNLERFNRLLHGAVTGRVYDEKDIAQDFRATFMRDNPDRGKRVLFTLLHWCGEYDTEVPTGEDLHRWAGRREVAARIKAALYADLSAPID